MNSEKGKSGFQKIHSHTTDGNMSKSYQAWRGILNRCYRANTKGFKYYGGRGITVCERWRVGENGVHPFILFVIDVGEPPTPDSSIDRIDTNGNYEPSNCRWATKAEQSRNKRSNRYITALGQTALMEDWAKALGTKASVLYNRLIRDGMSDEEAIRRSL